MRQETAPQSPEIIDTASAIAFQGELGAFSHQACRDVHPELTPLPCPTFEDAISAVRHQRARLAMLPVENSVYGRVADMHHLLPESDLHIIGEYFLPIRMQLLGLPDATLGDIRVAQSLNVALGQVRKFLQAHGIRAEAGPDTAGSARLVSELKDKSRAAVASELAGELNGLKVIAPDIEDATHNTTRFLITSATPVEPPEGAPTMTTFVFQVRNIPAALFKAMGGFATNGVNMVRLESYMLDGSFTATQFVADIEGRPSDENVVLALEELDYFTHGAVKILGVYEPHPFRVEAMRSAGL